MIISLGRPKTCGHGLELLRLWSTIIRDLFTRPMLSAHPGRKFRSADYRFRLLTCIRLLRVRLSSIRLNPLLVSEALSILG